jgi:2-methylcitrate dehydratase PrpD
MPSISLRDMVALGVVLGKLDYEDAHDEAALARVDVQRLRSVIRIEPDEALGLHRPERRCARVDIETSADTYRSREYIPPGHWELGGMPWDAVETKFRSLVDPRLGSEAAERLVSVVRGLDDVSQVTDLTELLVLS